MPGTLYVVATPIGNLEDLTFRALRTLKEVDVIAAEDTRRTAKLLAHYEVRKPMVSLHEHNEYKEVPQIIERLKAGQSVALVSDAGTPGIADPGARLVAAAHAATVTVVPVPGPSAVSAALSVSGFDASRFVFLGFPPRSGTAREEWLADLVTESRTLVFFEAPHRIERTLADVSARLGNRQIIVTRELTKIHEQLVIRHKTDALSPVELIGEFVVVVGPQLDTTAAGHDPDDIVRLLGRLTDNAAVSTEVAERMVAAELRVRPSDVRKAIKRHRISVKQQTSPSS